MLLPAHKDALENIKQMSIQFLKKRKNGFTNKMLLAQNSTLFMGRMDQEQLINLVFMLKVKLSIVITTA